MEGLTYTSATHSGLNWLDYAAQPLNTTFDALYAVWQDAKAKLKAQMGGAERQASKP